MPSSSEDSSNEKTINIQRLYKFDKTFEYNFSSTSKDPNTMPMPGAVPDAKDAKDAKQGILQYAKAWGGKSNSPLLYIQLHPR